jgi:hypothetical protein
LEVELRREPSPDQLRERLLRDGFVAVERALDPEFCEDVVSRRLIELGVDERDPGTWPAGRRNLPATTVYRLEEVAPAAADVLHDLVGGPDAIRFGDIPDNLILNFPDPAAIWFAPNEWRSARAGFHKDGDWFRHFLDSPEQGLLGIVFWRDVVADQGPTYVVPDSIGHVARFLAEHPEGIDPPVPIDDVLADCNDFRALTGSQGTIVWAHPFLVHSASVNRTERVRVISNTAVMLREPFSLSGPGTKSPIERSILDALGADEITFAPTRARTRVESERERRWRGQRDGQSPG